MSAVWRDGPVTVHVGHVLDCLRALDSDSVQCVVTSPPYWGLRDYGTPPVEWGDGWVGSLGREPTPELYVAHLVEVFREVRRVLRVDGTCWLNLGDTYSQRQHGRSQANGSSDGVTGRGPRGNPVRLMPPGLGKKQLVGIPWRVALALQADGWWLRSDIIWSKPNSMPESVSDRPTQAHEYIFLLTRSATYFYDAEAVREPAQDWGTRDRTFAKHNGPAMLVNGQSPHRGFTNGNQAATGRNLRDVWAVATQPYPGAHFATYPEELALRCIAAGTSERGCCPECGAPWVRVVERSLRPRDLRRPQTRRAVTLATAKGLTSKHIIALQAAGITDAGKAQVTQDGCGKNTAEVVALAEEAKAALGGYYREFLLTTPTTAGWQSTCTHDRNPTPCTVLDPFAGSGTTLAVARRMERTPVGCEMQPNYLPLIQRRVAESASLFEMPTEPVPAAPALEVAEQTILFSPQAAPVSDDGKEKEEAVASL